jgi:hypothetical protein
MADDDLPPAADELYGLTLEEFVGARNALAKRLRAEGDGKAAKRVGALRKPNVPAWTINQLVRSRSGDIGEFARTADELRAAQTDLLEGRGAPARLREARTAERAAVERLLELARGLFPGGREPAAATLDRIAATLHAAAADESVRDGVLSGRLLTDYEPSGFGDLQVELPDAPPAAAREEPVEAPERDAEAEAREAAERERRERVAALQEALDEATAERERAESALEAARAEEARLRSALDELD